MAAQDAKEPEPLELGHGKVELEVFLEPTCPFSKIAFGKLRPLLDAVGEDRLTIKIRFVSQPWHLFSGIVTRAILAATATPGGKEAGLAAMRGIYERREEFEFENHSSGPNMDCTPNQVVAQISALAGGDSPRRSSCRVSAPRSAGTRATRARTASTSRRPSSSTA